MSHCLYCNQDAAPSLTSFPIEKSPLNEALPSLAEALHASANSSSKDLTIAIPTYTCTYCGLTFTQKSIDAEEERLKRKDFDEKTGISDGQNTEEETFEAVKQMLQDYIRQNVSETCPPIDLQEILSLQGSQQSACDKAYDLLFQHGFPFKYPLEYMIYRDICHIGSFLMCEKSFIKKRYKLLDNMLSDMHHLDYYLPDNNTEELFQTLMRIGEALLLLGSLPIYCHTQIGSNNTPNYTDLTCRKRAAILVIFAARLEELQDTSHGTDYLKMALKLWNKALQQAQDVLLLTLLNLNDDTLSQLPYKTRKQINQKITLLSAQLKERDADFIPDKLPVQPLNIPPIITAGSLIICALLALVGIFALATLFYSITGWPIICLVTSSILAVVCWLFIEPLLVRWFYRIRS
ncbi:MAG: hypothetical protein Q4F00_10340 [bacterium]|nr:hypothetical protein [bacterium]